MSVPELRPLSVGEILDVAIKIYFRHAWTLFAIVVFVVAPVEVLNSLIDISATGGFYTGTGSEFEPDDASTFAAGLILIVLLTLLSTTLATAACFKAVADGYLRERPSVKGSLAFVVRRLHSVVWIAILAYVLGGLALFALVVPAIWLFVSWTVAIPALLTEDVRGLKALRRSFRLVRHRWWPTFGIVVLGSLLAGIVSSAIGAAVGGLTFSAESDVAILIVAILGGTLGSMLTTPFTAAFTIVLYVDLRVRKEGFDLALLAQRIGREPGAELPLPAPPPAGAAPAPLPALDGGEPPFWPPPPGWKG